MWVAVTVGFIRATHVWVKFFVAAAARFIPPFMTRARKLQQTTFKNNGDGNGHGQWQWLWLLLSLVHKCCTIPSEPSHRWQEEGVADIVLSGMRPPAIYWHHRWRAAYLLELVSLALPRVHFSVVRFVELFCSFAPGRSWAGHSHFLRTLFWPVCDVAFKGSPDFVNLSRDSFRIWPKDIFAVWHGLAVNFLPICTFLGDECYKYAANVLSHHKYIDLFINNGLIAGCVLLWCQFVKFYWVNCFENFLFRDSGFWIAKLLGKRRSKGKQMIWVLRKG